MENDQTTANLTLTSEEITEITNSLTRDCFLVLKTIYECPNIQHKEICKKLGKTANNLSNRFNRIDDIKKINGKDCQLILSTKMGTTKHYSLSAIGTQYVEQALRTEKQSSPNTKSGHSKSTEIIMTKGRKAANLLKEKCGYNLHTTLSSLLEEEKNVTVNEEIQNLYQELLDTLCICRKNQDIDLLKQILDSLEDEMIVNQMTTILNKKFIYYDLLKPLLTPGKFDNVTQFQIIDNVFAELYPAIFMPYPDKEFQNTLLTPTEWDNLLLGVIKLYNAFISEPFSKSTAVANWETYYLTKELAFYIAEKCSFLMFLQRFIPSHN